ncbi:hypothetical protein B0H13DRAFT_2371945 [Mycena leptocephala]|nr:hypothetical protein B0H13DRAFT_2371945 [Mycena leptocephala]
MATTQTNDEKEWKGLKLTPITEEYVGGPDYKPPTIPKLRSSVQVQGVNGTGETVAVTVPGNETEVAAAKKEAEAWLSADKKALSISVKAVPIGKLYIVRDCHSVHDAWHALNNEYEPANALTAVTIKQQIISYQCDSSENPVRWREVMIQLYGKLRDADPNIMPDTKFAKHLVTLMTQSEEWRDCRDSAPQRCFEGGSLAQMKDLNEGSPMVLKPTNFIEPFVRK